MEEKQAKETREANDVSTTDDLHARDRIRRRSVGRPGAVTAAAREEVRRSRQSSSSRQRVRRLRVLHRTRTRPRGAAIRLQTNHAQYEKLDADASRGTISKYRTAGRTQGL